MPTKKHSISYKPLYLIPIVLVLLVVSLALYQNRSKLMPTLNTLPTDQPQLTVKLNPLNSSNEYGVATFFEKDGNTTVTIKVEGYDKNKDQPVHIHLGVCPGLGKVLYPLKNVVDGQSVTTIDTTIAGLKDKLPLAINIHESASNFKGYVSCGELVIP